MWQICKKQKELLKTSWKVLYSRIRTSFRVFNTWYHVRVFNLSWCFYSKWSFLCSALLKLVCPSDHSVMVTLTAHHKVTVLYSSKKIIPETAKLCWCVWSMTYLQVCLLIILAHTGKKDFIIAVSSRAQNSQRKDFKLLVCLKLLLKRIWGETFLLFLSYVYFRNASLLSS